MFRSFSCLNASFPSATVRTLSAFDPGLDLTDLREAYRAMVQGAPKVLHWLGTSTSRLINSMPQMKHDQPEMLRYILILMEVCESESCLLGLLTLSRLVESSHVDDLPIQWSHSEVLRRLAWSSPQ